VLTDGSESVAPHAKRLILGCVDVPQNWQEDTVHTRVYSPVRLAWPALLALATLSICGCASGGSSSTFVSGSADQTIIDTGVWDFRATVHARERQGPAAAELRGQLLARGEGRFDVTFSVDGRPWRCRDIGLAPRRGVRQTSGRLLFFCQHLRLELRNSDGTTRGEAYLTDNSGGVGRGTLTLERVGGP
jgi:hypothetical protein